MGKLKVFSLTFDSPQIVYYPGQLLSGCLDVQLDQPMEMRSIKLEVCSLLVNTNNIYSKSMTEGC